MWTASRRRWKRSSTFELVFCIALFSLNYPPPRGLQHWRCREKPRTALVARKPRALGEMLAMIKERLATLSAPTDVAAMPLLRRSSACAPPRMLETVHEKSTGAAAERYRTWFLGSVRMRSCDTEGKVRGGMAFGLRSKTMTAAAEAEAEAEAEAAAEAEAEAEAAAAAAEAEAEAAAEAAAEEAVAEAEAEAEADDLPMVDARAHMPPPPVPLGHAELLMSSVPSFTSVIELGDLVAAAELATEPVVARKGAEVVPEVVPEMLP